MSLAIRRAAPALLVLALPLLGACGGPPDDRAEARARVEAAAESLRAAHEEEWGVMTEEERTRLAEEERARLREDSAAAEDEED